MVFDWKNGKEEALANGVYEKEGFGGKRIAVKATEGAVENHIFRNFPQIEFENDAIISGCVFENCGMLTFDENTVINCEFCNIGAVYFTCTTVNKSRFRDLVCEEEVLISLEDTNIRHSAFNGITLLDEAYLFEAYGDCTVSSCTFANIKTTREDEELDRYEEPGGFLKKSKRFMLIDTRTCEGYNNVEVIKDSD